MLESGGDNMKRLGQFRNRPTNRRNSRDRLDRVNSLGDIGGGGSVGSGGGGAGETLPVSREISGAAGETFPAESTCFSSTEAAHVMSQRWTATINALKDPSVDAAERPVVYSSTEGGSGWGSSKLPFQASVSDFVQEMGQAVLRSNTTRVSNANHSGLAKVETPAGAHN